MTAEEIEAFVSEIWAAQLGLQHMVLYTICQSTTSEINAAMDPIKM